MIANAGAWPLQLMSGNEIARRPGESCMLIRMAVWRARRSEVTICVRYQACPHDVHLVRLADDTCSGFYAGASRQPVRSRRRKTGPRREDLPDSADPCPALLVP